MNSFITVLLIALPCFFWLSLGLMVGHERGEKSGLREGYATGRRHEALGYEDMYGTAVADDDESVPGGRTFPTVDHEAIALLKSDPAEYFRQCREGRR